MLDDLKTLFEEILVEYEGIWLYWIQYILINLNHNNMSLKIEISPFCSSQFSPFTSPHQRLTEKKPTWADRMVTTMMIQAWMRRKLKPRFSKKSRESSDFQMTSRKFQRPLIQTLKSIIKAGQSARHMLLPYSKSFAKTNKIKNEHMQTVSVTNASDWSTVDFDKLDDLKILSL